MSFKLLGSLVLATVFALAVAQTPSPHPTTEPTPSKFWHKVYWTTAYEYAVTSNWLAGVPNYGPPLAYWTLNDLVTHTSVVEDEGGVFHGSYSGRDDGDIVLGASDANAVSGTAFKLMNNNVAVTLPTGGFMSTGTPSQEWTLEFWTKQAGAGTLVAQFCGNTVAQSGNSVAVNMGGQVVNSRPGDVTGEYTHVLVTVTPLDATNAEIALFINSIRQSIDVAPLAAILSGSCPLAFQGNDIWLDEVAIYPAALSQDAIITRYVAGRKGKCREEPCFSASECIPLGADSFDCGPCPPRYSGDGIRCTAIPTYQDFYRCHPETQQELDEPLYCKDNCDSRSRCFICTMNYYEFNQTLARRGCEETFPDDGPAEGSTDGGSDGGDPCAGDPCLTGFRCEADGNSFNCVDIDECAEETHNCVTGFECNNNPGSFSCDDIDECVEETHNCGVGFACDNTVGSFDCNDIDECTEVGEGICDPGYECENTVGSFDCNDINECITLPDRAGCGQACRNLNGSYECICIVAGTDLANGTHCRSVNADVYVPLEQGLRIASYAPDTDLSNLGLTIGRLESALNQKSSIMLDFDLESLIPGGDALVFETYFNVSRVSFNYRILLTQGETIKVGSFILNPMVSSWHQVVINTTDPIPGDTWNTVNTNPKKFDGAIRIIDGRGFNADAAVDNWESADSEEEGLPLLVDFASDRLNGVTDDFGVLMKVPGGSSAPDGTVGENDIGDFIISGAGSEPHLEMDYIMWVNIPL